ncbi:MAG TPA: hypothetical protein VJS12_14090 [Steroidobacteraceae bacterium]|nr:hypothetical protein [Steroidobacteraceae bacterium]
MRKLCMAVATVCALGTTTPLLAADRTEFQISPRLGRGVLKLDQFRNVDEDLAELDTGGLGVSFAVVTPIGLMAEAGTESYGNFDFFNADDEFRLRQDYVALGYQFELGEGWHIVPKVGRSKWELTSEKGWLLHDDDVETDRQRGYEYFWALDFNKRVNDVMSLGATVRSGSYEFGDAGSVAFVMTFSF